MENGDDTMYWMHTSNDIHTRMTTIQKTKAQKNARQETC